MKLSKQQIGAILKKLREDKGYTQREVAEHFGRTQQIIGHWETGYSQPDAGTLFDLCDFYGADITQAFGFSKTVAATCSSDLEIAQAYHIANSDDRAIVELTLKKYMTKPTSDDVNVEPLNKGWPE